MKSEDRIPRARAQPDAEVTGFASIVIISIDGYKNRYAILISQRTGYMALSGGGFRQQDVTGIESKLGAIAKLHLAFPAQGNDILPTRRIVPVDKIIR